MANTLTCNKFISKTLCIRLISAGFMFLLLAILLYLGGEFVTSAFAILTILMLRELFTMGEWKKAPSSYFIKIFFTLYILTSMLCLVMLYQQFNYSIIIILAILLCANDSGAYFIGSFVKGPKLIPMISPSKTWSGFIGGVLVGVLITYNATHYLFNMPQITLQTCFFLSLASHSGDLIESGLKRYFKVKDAGNIIPGHGGVLDRLDSLLFVNFMAYLLIK